MRVLVCGGRDYGDRDQLNRALDRAHRAKPITLLICGGAHGADSMAMDWANNNNIKCEVYPADWEQFGKRAGPIRNREMLLSGQPDAVIAFPGNRGTRDMVDASRRKGVPVYEINGKHTPLNFHTEPERRQWIIDNAAYFTTFLRVSKLKINDEWPTLAKAQRAAQRLARQHHRIIMIYAVAADGRDTWVENVK